MSLVEQQIVDLEMWLGKKIGIAYKTAIAINEPGGNSEEWINLIAYYKLKEITKEERTKSVLATGLKRGAPVSEVYEVFNSIVKSASNKFKKIKRPMDDNDEIKWEKLRDLIDRIHGDTLKSYKKLVVPKRSMFSFAKEAAENSEGVKSFNNDEGFVMCCSGCGAPRLKTTDFECDFCGGSFANGE